MTHFSLDKFIDPCVRTITKHAQELTQLDQAIGDGDHGINLKRGFDALANLHSEIATLRFGEALQKMGMTLVLKIGGASGPLYGSLLMGMGKASANGPADFTEAQAMLEAGIALVQKRGKSGVGEKTMLDVLIPVAVAFEYEDFEKIRQTANESLELTRNMRATKGRASFLGERSIGHLDPGARSTNLLIHTICDVLEDK